MAQEEFPRFFNPAELGKSLKEVATDLLAMGPQNVVSRWFHSAQDADLFVWLDERGQIIKQQLTFYGQVVEWNVIEGVRTGMVVEFEERPQAKAAEVIQFDPRPQARAIRQAADLIGFVEALNDSERKAVVLNFVRGETIAELDAEEFVRRFGNFLNRRPLARRSNVRSFWTRALAFWRRRRE